MAARIHHLAWIVGAALVGAAACGGEGGPAKGTPPGEGNPPGGGGGTQPAACVGPAWFGTIDEAKRTTVMDHVCADARVGAAPTARLTGDAGPSCKGAFTVKSDEEIAAILAAVDDGLTHQAAVGEQKASSAEVKDLARLVHASHVRAGEEEKNMLKRRRMRSEADPVSRALVKGFDDAKSELGKVQQGPTFDRELVSRTVIQLARAIDLYDQLAPQVKDEDMRCAVEKSRDVALAHLALACQTMASLPPVQARPAPRPTATPARQVEPAPAVAPPAPAPTVTAEPPAAPPAEPVAVPATPAEPMAVPATPADPAPAPADPAPVPAEVGSPPPCEPCP